MADEKLTKQGLEMDDQELDTVVGGAIAIVKKSVTEFYDDEAGKGMYQHSSTLPISTEKFTPAKVKSMQQAYSALSSEAKASYRVEKPYLFEQGWPLYGF